MQSVRDTCHRNWHYDLSHVYATLLTSKVTHIMERCLNSYRVVSRKLSSCIAEHMNAAPNNRLICTFLVTHGRTGFLESSSGSFCAFLHSTAYFGNQH
jgi:hypothetical protein